MNDPILINIATNIFWDLVKVSSSIIHKQTHLGRILQTSAKKCKIENRNVLRQFRTYVADNDLSPESFDSNAIADSLRISNSRANCLVKSFWDEILKDSDLVEWLQAEYLKSLYKNQKIIGEKIDQIIDSLTGFDNRFQKKQIELNLPLPPCLHNQTPPEPNFTGRKVILDELTKWWHDSDVRVGALIGWGGVGKSSIVRKWYDLLDNNDVAPDGVFWWGFYRNKDLNSFFGSLLQYINPNTTESELSKSAWEKVDRIKTHLQNKRFLIILIGFFEVYSEVATAHLYKPL